MKTERELRTITKRGDPIMEAKWPQTSAVGKQKRMYEIKFYFTSRSTVSISELIAPSLLLSWVSLPFSNAKL